MLVISDFRDRLTSGWSGSGEQPILASFGTIPGRSTAEELRQKHRDHLSSAGKKLLGSGALLSDDGVRIIGGLLPSEKHLLGEC